MLPIGDLFTMGPREAAYGDSPPGSEGCRTHTLRDVSLLDRTVEELRKATKMIKGLKIHALKPGETL